MRIFLTLLFGIILLSCNKGKNNEGSCNGSSTRRDVKIAIDDLATEIDTIPVVISVDSIGALVVDEANKDSERQAVEKQIYQVTGLVHKLSKHRDGDFKVKLISENEKYLNCEAPNLGCEYIDSSLFLSQMEIVRNFIEMHQDSIVGKTVTIQGVGFVDIDHKYPRNAAENEMELHPITAIWFE